MKWEPGDIAMILVASTLPLLVVVVIVYTVLAFMYGCEPVAQ